MNLQAAPPEPKAEAPNIRIEVSRRLVVINSISSVCSRVVTVLVWFWVNKLLLEKRDLAEVALLPVVTAVMMFGSLLTSMLSGGVARYVVEACATNKAQGVSEIVSSIFPLLAAGEFCFLGLTSLFAYHVDWILDIQPDLLAETRIMMLILACTSAYQVMLLPFSVGLFARQRFVTTNVIQIGQEFLRIALLLTLMFGVGVRVLWVVVASSCATVVGETVTMLISRHLIPQLRFRPHLFRWARAKQLVSFGAWTTVGQLAYMINKSSDPLVLQKFTGPGDVVSFYQGSTFDTQVLGMTSVASAPVLPALTAMHSRGESDRLRSAYIRGGCFGLWASLFAACPLIVYRSEFLHLYIKDTEFLFDKTAWVILLLMSVYPFTYATTMLHKIAAAKAHIRPFFLTSILTQLANLGITVALVGYFRFGYFRLGAVGSALATAFTSITSQLFFFWPMGLRMVDLSLRTFLRKTVIPGLLPALSGLVVWESLRHVHEPHSWFALVINVAAGSLVYLAVLFKFGLRKDERDELVGLLGKLRRVRPGG
jgi:O-antigen/teichoic acid export membrane protein